jgi:hypothetical protein
MSTCVKPYSEACEQNKQPILAVLQEVFTQPGLIVEIGAGSGQHAVHFARALPHLRWQPTDLAENLPGIELWLAEANLPNLNPPLELEVCRQPWPLMQAAGVFSANTTHIMAWAAVECLFTGVGQILQPGGAFCLYGPFNYSGVYTSASNAEFDQWLRSWNLDGGLRDFEALDQLATRNGLRLQCDYPMPANNRTLVWVHC